MDLNVAPPAVWHSLTRGPYELAAHCAAQGTDVLVLLNAWLDSQQDTADDTDWQTINYWALRLRPLWAKVAEEAAGAGARDSVAGGRSADGGRKPGEELLVVVCNRCGVENGKGPRLSHSGRMLV